MRVGTADALQHADLHIGLIVAVGVLQKPYLGQGRDKHAAAPEFKSRDTIQIVGKGYASIGHSVASVVREANDLVATGFFWIPMGIGRPDRNKQPSIGIDCHLHRIDDFRKHFFGGEKIDLHAVSNAHLFNRFFTTQINMLAVRQLARNICFDFEFRRQIAVIHDFVLTTRNRPNTLVAVGCHDIENFHLSHHDIGIRLPKPSQFGATTKHVVAVNHTVTAEPVVILVEHRLPQPHQLLVIFFVIFGNLCCAK